jgi:hypothetical protein
VALSGGAYNDGTVFKLAITATGCRARPNCIGQSISFLARQFGGIAHDAAALGYASVADLQNVVRNHCGGQPRASFSS